MKKAVLILIATITIFITYLLIKTFLFSSDQLVVDPIQPTTIPEGAIDRFQEALRIKTISFETSANFDSAEFRKFNELITQNYPLTDSLLEHITFSEFSHLYRWEGKNPALKPVVLMGHIDVVPIASPEKWTVDPFEGEIKEDKIWGRGTIDDKSSVIAILESVENLLAVGFQPQRTIYLSFGHDEEVGGEQGAVKIANYLKQNEVVAEYVLDEGYAITQQLIPGISQDVAMIGIAEKGSTTIKLTVNLKGGHSSQPAKSTAIDVLATAISRLKASPLEPTLSEPMQGFMDQIGPEMGFVNRMAFANREIFKGVIIGIYENVSGAGNALVRTTTSPTIFQAGVKENVIPTTATALVNFRIIPGQTADDVMEHVEQVIDDDRVETEFTGFNTNPSKVSSIESEGYGIINKTIKQVFRETLTAPNLVIAATDSRHFGDISENVYRFVPYHINQDNISTFHGIDERILVADYENAIRFYRQLILNSN